MDLNLIKEDISLIDLNKVNTTYIPSIYTITNKAKDNISNLDFIFDTNVNIISLCNKNLFSKLNKVNKQVKQGKASKIQVKYTGESSILFSKRNFKLNIKNIYYILSLGLNILEYSAISHLIKADLNGNILRLYSKKSNKLIAQGYKKEGLYYIPFYI